MRHEEKLMGKSLPTTPTNLHEYQKKRLTKFAFHKLQIQKDMFLVEQAENRQTGQP